MAGFKDVESGWQDSKILRGWQDLKMLRVSGRIYHLGLASIEELILNLMIIAQG